MKRISFYLIIMISALACDEIFEDDISDATIEIIAPRDSLVTTKTTLTFWWNELGEANSYKLQIVSTSFDTILSIPVDTMLSTNKFEVTLNPGRYGWRIKAINSATETEWFAQKLTILDVPNLTEQEVLLKSPKEGDAFGNGKLKFQWTKLPNATNYILIVKFNSWEGSLAFPSEVTVNDTLTKTLEEGKYIWGVRGFNESSQSKIQNKTFFVDLTPPENPVLQQPANNSTITGTSTTLQWIHPSDDLTTVYDSIYVSKDNTFTQENSIEKVKLTTTSYSFSNSTYKGKVYWRVKTIDKAGNKSSFSSTFNFTLE
ncbi:MAG: hypothetical protein AB9846_17890 [Tenuifilaceae bacterium]